MPYWHSTDNIITHPPNERISIMVPHIGLHNCVLCLSLVKFTIFAFPSKLANLQNKEQTEREIGSQFCCIELKFTLGKRVLVQDYSHSK